MKKLTFLAASILLLFIYSCQPEHNCGCMTAIPIKEVMTAERNGVAWQLPIVKSTFINDTIRIATNSISIPSNTEKDSLNLSVLYVGTGNYKLTAKQAAYFTGLHSSGLPANYVLDTTFDNTLDITSYQVMDNPYTTVTDPVKITGTFNLRFINPANTTSVSLLDGKFTAILGN